MTDKAEDYLLNEQASVAEALNRLEKNSGGVLFCTDKDGRPVCSITDGDIRRGLLSGCSNEDLAANLGEKNFKALPVGVSREELLKLLDMGVEAIPMIDPHGVISEVVTKKTVWIKPEGNTIFSRAPARISLSGGGTDLSDYYMSVSEGGAVLAFAISKYATVLLKRSIDNRFVVRSGEFNLAKNYSSVDEMSRCDVFGLIGSVLVVMGVGTGFDIDLKSDFGVGTGLGGSSALCVALVRAFDLALHRGLNKYEVAEMAFQAERLSAKVAGGWQDHYSSSFGGMNLISFKRDDNLVIPLKIERDVVVHLEAHLWLVPLRTKRSQSQDPIVRKGQALRRGSSLALENLRNLVFDMKSALLKGDVSSLGHYLDRAWAQKKASSEKISNREADELYDLAKSLGATGGKLLGAGGGGYMLIFVPLSKQIEFIKGFVAFGYAPERVVFEQDGARAFYSDRS